MPNVSNTNADHSLERMIDRDNIRRCRCTYLHHLCLVVHFQYFLSLCLRAVIDQLLKILCCMMYICNISFALKHTGHTKLLSASLSSRNNANHDSRDETIGPRPRLLTSVTSIDSKTVTNLLHHRLTALFSLSLSQQPIHRWKNVAMANKHDKAKIMRLCEERVLSAECEFTGRRMLDLNCKI